MARGVQLLERNSNEQTVVNTRREGDQGCSGNGEYCGGEGEGGWYRVCERGMGMCGGIVRGVSPHCTVKLT